MFFWTGERHACITFTGMKVVPAWIGTGAMMLFWMSCKESKTEPTPQPEQTLPMGLEFTPGTTDYDTTLWKEIRDGDGYILDIRYATRNNFTGDTIYPCPRFFLRPAVAMALKACKKELHGKGLYASIV
jgi:hypothetical protein